ncbi:MAG: S9 family peptidase [Vicinamibacterales bacterium]
MPLTQPYGTWPSPFTAASVAGVTLRLGGVAVDGGDIYWLEGRPVDGGRTTLVCRRANGEIVDVTAPGANVRTRVHEYGGGAYLVSRGHVVYAEFTDQRLYRLDPGGSATPITLPGPWRYADATRHPSRPHLVCVREDHSAGGHEPSNTLVRIALDGPMTCGDVVASGFDFYASPRFSPDGAQLLWLSWRHPNMPWDGTELWLADVEPDGSPRDARRIAGGPAESIVHPGWGTDGRLYFVSDRSGWWNLHGYRDGEVEALCPVDAEFGRPLWQFGMSTWAPIDASRLAVACGRRGRWCLATLDVDAGALATLPTDVEPGDGLVATATSIVCIGLSPRAPDAVVRVDLATGGTTMLRRASAIALEAADVSEPEPVEFPTDGDVTAHAFYYAPRSAAAVAPDGERPPLIVISHGGPTAAAVARLSMDVQYWTSRGFAVADVDYGGSTGYGRAYRERLNGRWGIVDVADCVNLARYLVAQGKADASRLIIRGGSAGGYTTLAALTFQPHVFKAGASYYGVSDLEVLARDTHKFESRYLETLVGPYPARRDVYVERSPIHAVDRLACPLILLQGREDAVVPPNQAEMMADAVREKGFPVALLVFEGEQHGFRRRESIQRALEAELAFYGAIFGFTPDDALPPLQIDNLETWLARRAPR